VAKARKKKSQKKAVKTPKSSGSAKKRGVKRNARKPKRSSRRSSARVDDLSAKEMLSAQPEESIVPVSEPAVSPDTQEPPLLHKSEVLEQEIELVFRKINHFDGLRHRTKQVAVVLTVATVAMCLTMAPGWVVVVAALVPVPFWCLDASYHSNQEGWNKRFWKIQAYLNGRWKGDDGEFPIPDYCASHSLSGCGAHDFLTSLERNAFTPRMKMFYLPLVIAPLFLAIVASMMGAN
jgi:hypothetical protein